MFLNETILLFNNMNSKCSRILKLRKVSRQTFDASTEAAEKFFEN